MSECGADPVPLTQQCIVPFNASITVPCLLENTPTRILTDIYFQIGLSTRLPPLLPPSPLTVI